MTYMYARMRDAGRTSINRDGTTRYTDIWQVYRTDGEIASFQEIQANVSLYEFNSLRVGTNAYLNDIEFAPEPRNRAKWTITYTYETLPEQEQNDPDPVEQNAVIAFSTYAMERYAGKSYQDGDKQGAPTKPIENTAGDPFIDPPVEQLQLTMILITKNYSSSFKAANIKDFKNTTNLSAITIGGIKLAAKEGWLQEMTMEPARKPDNTLYYQVRYNVVVNPETWTERLLSHGFYHLTTGADQATRTKIKDSDIKAGGEDEAVTDPQKLKENGTLWTPGSDVYYVPTDLKFAKDWGPLSLPPRQDGAPR